MNRYFAGIRLIYEREIAIRSLFPILLVILLCLSTFPTHAQDAGAEPVPTVQKLLTWEQCREYLPSKKSPECRIDFDMTQTKDIRIPPQTHKDITVHLGHDGRGVVVLWHSSPFAACSLTTTPGPLARDLSPNISAALTSMAGLGAIPQAVLAGESVNANMLISAASQPVQALNEQQRGQLVDIQKDEDAITSNLRDFATLAAPYDSLNPENAPADVDAIRKAISYSYTDDDAARKAVDNIYASASKYLARPLPDAKSPLALAAKLDAIRTGVTKLQNTYPANQINGFVDSANEQIAIAANRLARAQRPETAVLVTYLNDATTKVQKLIDFISDWRAQDLERTNRGNPTDASVQALPIALYSESKVAVQVKCTDPVTAAPLFDAIQFNAYFQSPPIFDISTGLLISTVHGRQAATQTPFGNPASTSCPATATTTANCPVVVINQTRPQFMPGVFGELHFWNFKLPGVHEPADDNGKPPGRIPTWMSENAPRHPFGYVGSFGLAGGLLVNPNNGTTQAEFFEGISFGIQRFVFLIGNHTGRSQNLTNGYYLGQQVASGTTPTTVRNWSNGLAFGITYRIPLR
jgi:hypothetical protein